MFRWILKIAKRIWDFFRSPLGKKILAAADQAIPIIQQIKRQEALTPDTLRDAEDIFLRLQQNEEWGSNIVKTIEAKRRIIELIKNDPKLSPYYKQLTTDSSLNLILETAYSTQKHEK